MTDLPRLWPRDVSPEMRDLIERSCTPRQVDVLKLKAYGFGKRRIADELGISPSAVSDRMRSGMRRVLVELEKREAA